MSVHFPCSFILYHPEKLEIVAIGEYKVVINVLGTVYVSQEYGKGEDFVAMSNNYPFTVTLDVSVSDPSDIGLDAEDIKVDTSSWFE